MHSQSAGALHRRSIQMNLTRGHAAAMMVPVAARVAHAVRVCPSRPHRHAEDEARWPPPYQ